jgi:hypothetical protein
VKVVAAVPGKLTEEENQVTNVGDILLYCYDCTYQNNTTQEGIGPGACPQCYTVSPSGHRWQKGLRIWKVEPGEKEWQESHVGKQRTGSG